MSFKLASFRWRHFVKIGLGIAAVVILGPITINHATRDKAINAETPGDTCVVKDQATKNLLVNELPDIYSAVPDSNKTEVQILDPTDTIGNTTYDDEVVCVPGVKLRREIGGYGSSSMTANIKVSNFKYHLYSGVARGSIYLRGDYVDLPLLTALDLIGIDYATNLTQIRLFDYNLSNLNELSSYFTKVEGLELSHCIVSDIAPLSSLTNLIWLDVSDGQITDLSSISSMTNLESLRLASNNISNIAPLSNLVNLTTLDLANNQISNITPIGSLNNLVHLDLVSNQISDIAPISSLTNLSQLSLDANQISNIAPLHGLVKLSSLRLAFNSISNIAPLSSLTNLSHVDLSGNLVTDLTPLRNLEFLEFLRLTVSQVTDLSLIGDLTGLVGLDLSNNQISDITSLSSLMNLQYLALRSNQISDVTPLAALTNLHYLDISFNQIEDLSPLSGLNLDEYNFNKSNQYVIRYTHGQTIWSASFKDEQGNLYEVEDVSNLIYDQDSQTVAIINPDEVAYAGYDCSPYSGGSICAKGKSASTPDPQTCKNAVFFLPSKDNIGFSNKTVNDSVHIDVNQGDEFTYETRAVVPNNTQRLALIGPTTFYSYDTDAHQLVSVRLVEDVDPRITPLSSELYVDNVPFDETSFARYYQADVAINGQTIEANVTPFYLLPTSNPHYIDEDEWYNNMYNNSDEDFDLNNLTEPLPLSLRTTAKLASSTPPGQTDIPSRSQFYLGIISFNPRNPYAPPELSFKKFGDNVVTVSFLSGAVPIPESEIKPPRSGGSEDSTVSVLIAISIIVLGLSGWVFSHRQRRHFS